MYITKSLCYADIEKTGCTFVRMILKNVLLENPSYTLKHRKGPFKKQKLLVSVRNPLSQYVSLWAFGCEKHGRFWKEFPYKDMYSDFFVWIDYVLMYYPQLMTNRIKKQVPSWGRIDIVIHQENLVEDLTTALRGFPVYDGYEEFIRIAAEKPHNPSTHKDWSEYYDKGTEERVRRSEKKIFETFY